MQVGLEEPELTGQMDRARHPRYHRANYRTFINYHRQSDLVTISEASSGAGSDLGTYASTMHLCIKTTDVAE